MLGEEVGSAISNDSPVYLPVCPSSWAWDWEEAPEVEDSHPGSTLYTDLSLCGWLPACGPVAGQAEGLWNLPRAYGEVAPHSGRP